MVCVCGSMVQHDLLEPSIPLNNLEKHGMTTKLVDLIQDSLTCHGSNSELLHLTLGRP